MYYMYSRVVILGALSRHSSVWTRSHSYGLCQILHICSHLYKRFTCKALNRIAPSFRSVPVFLPPLYKSFVCKNLNATFPFPQVFSLSPFPLAREPTVTAWRGTTLGRDITNAISLIMLLRLRGSYATERHAFSYFSSSPTLDTVAALRLQRERQAALA